MPWYFIHFFNKYLPRVIMCPGYALLVFLFLVLDFQLLMKQTRFLLSPRAPASIRWQLNIMKTAKAWVWWCETNKPWQWVASQESCFRKEDFLAETWMKRKSQQGQDLTEEYSRQHRHHVQRHSSWKEPECLRNRKKARRARARRARGTAVPGKMGELGRGLLMCPCLSGSCLGATGSGRMRGWTLRLGFLVQCFWKSL